MGREIFTKKHELKNMSKKKIKDNPGQVGSPLKEEYTEKEMAKILTCETEHKFYTTGSLYGALITISG